MARKRWIPVVVGIIIFIVIVGIGVIAGGIYLVKTQVDVQTVETSSGAEEFDRLRAGFEGQKPFIELKSNAGEEATAVVNREPAERRPGKVSTVHVRVWSPDENKLVRVDLPFWMMRLMGSKPINIETGHGAFKNVALRVSAEDLERRGPGLVMDYATPDGEAVLVWID